MATILCKAQRPGGTQVILDDNTPFRRVVNFQPNADGDHVADVTDEQDVAFLLAITDGYEAYVSPAVKAAERAELRRAHQELRDKNDRENARLARGAAEAAEAAERAAKAAEIQAIADAEAADKVLAEAAERADTDAAHRDAEPAGE